MCHGLFYCFLVSQGTDEDTLFSPWANFHVFDAMNQGLGKAVMDTTLDEYSIGSNTGLARVPKFSQDTSFHGDIDIGIVKDQEWTVSTELHGHLLDVGCTLLHENLPYSSAACETELFNPLVCAKLGTDLGNQGHGGDCVDGLGRNAGFQG